MKYIECKDCKNIYKCEYTHMGGCSNGDPWETKTIDAYKYPTEDSIVFTKEQVENIVFKFDDEEISFTELFAIFFSLNNGEKLVVEDVNPIGIVKVKVIKTQR